MSQQYKICKHRGTFVLSCRDATGKRHRYKLNTCDESEAERLAPSLYAEVIRPRGKTVAELWGAYSRAKAGKASMATRPFSWKALEKRFGPMPGDTITRLDCEAHITARRSAGIKDGTIYTEMTLLRTILRWSVGEGLLTKAPKIVRPPQTVRKEGYFTKEQCRTLIDAAELPHIKLYITLALGTGARNAALLGLTWGRVDFARGTIDLRDPTIGHPHKGRAVVPMTNTVKAALLGAHGYAQSNYVVEWRSGPVKSVKKSIKSAAIKAGLLDVSPHRLRHSAAVHMAEAGVPMEEIAQFLGHDDVTVTRRIYARFSPEYLRKAANALEY